MAEGNLSPYDLNRDCIKEMITSGRQRMVSCGPGSRAMLHSPDHLRTCHKITAEQHLATLDPAFIYLLHRPKDNIYPSTTSLVNLTATMIRELRLAESARGKFIIVRIIEEFFAYTNYNTVVEDFEGNVCSLFIYNFPLEELIGCKGCVLMIKEPYFRVNIYGNPFIRCDCPSDILLFRQSFPMYDSICKIKWKNEVVAQNILLRDSIPINSQQWRATGAQMCRENQPVAAREAYLLGIKKCASSDDPTYKTLQIKLLEVHLKLGWYELTVTACRDLLVQFPNNLPTTFRLGQAYHMQRKYTEALEQFTSYCKAKPGDKRGREALRRVQARVEEENGNINVDKLREISQENPFKKIECADYQGPVEIMEIPGKGCGLVLTEDVAKDRILIVSKALVFTYLPKCIDMRIPPVKEDQLDSISSVNVESLAVQIYKNPVFFGSRVYELFSGTYTEEPIDPNSTQEAICDVERIRSIYRYNKFAMPKTINGEVIEKGEGLFLLPSFLNHACCSPNVDIEFFNDIMIVRASTDLKADTELTTSYVPRNINLPDRKEMLRRRGIEECLCVTCKP